MTTIIYHANCWDGFCAAWIARRALGDDVDLHAAHYGTEPPDVLDKDVWVLDFSYPRDTLETMHRAARSLSVLDHHKTAEAALRGLPYCTFDMNKSGGRLTWEHFHPGEPSPWLVDYTEDRDLWRHALPKSESVNAALRSYPLSMTDLDWLSTLQPDDLAIEGSAIRRREKQIVDDHTRNAVEITMDGHRIYAVNATVLFSEIAGQLAIGRPFGACWFQRSDGKRQWSLRSREGGVDVSEIAAKNGGGGHAQAAGFETDGVPG